MVLAVSSWPRHHKSETFFLVNFLSTCYEQNDEFGAPVDMSSAHSEVHEPLFVDVENDTANLRMVRSPASLASLLPAVCRVRTASVLASCDDISSAVFRICDSLAFHIGRRPQVVLQCPASVSLETFSSSSRVAWMAGSSLCRRFFRPPRCLDSRCAVLSGRKLVQLHLQAEHRQL